MQNVTILIEGYAKETSNGWLASSTTSLIEDKGKKILVDPGINRQLLLAKLGENKLAPDDIDIVFMTHYHPDHAFLVSLFEKAIICDGDTVYEKDSEAGYEGTIPGTDIGVLLTPGHAHEHAALVLETQEGTVVVAADVFWWMEGEEQKTDSAEILINREDPFVKDWEALTKSRRQILDIADWIIPGHGTMFKNPAKP